VKFVSQLGFALSVSDGKGWEADHGGQIIKQLFLVLAYFPISRFKLVAPFLQL